MYNIIASQLIINNFKKSKYFKTSLGQAISSGVDNKRTILKNNPDEFVNFYMKEFGRIAYMTGKIGTINLFKDFGIINDDIVLFYKNKKFIYKYGITTDIDMYLNNLIMDIETKSAEEINDSTDLSELIDNANKPNPDKVLNDPGSATYADIKAYLDRIKKEKTSI